MQEHGQNRYNVVGAYVEMRDAREAIEALEFAGVEASDISLLGEVAAEAAERADEETNTAARDRGIISRVAGRAILFGSTGAIAGAILGLLLAGIGAEFARVGDSVAVQAASWGLFGAIVGSLIGAYSAFAIGRAWELTFEPAGGGEVLVGVHSEDAKEAEKAARVLREKGALRVARFDARGRPQSA